MRLRLETDEAYCGSLQERIELQADHDEMLGLDIAAEDVMVTSPRPMSREEYLESLRQRFPLNSDSEHISRIYRTGGHYE